MINNTFNSQNSRPPRTIKLTLLAFSILIEACTTIGPDHLRDTHPLYNTAIVDSLRHQFLNNLVRLRYREPTYFLDVASVAATMRLSITADVGGQITTNNSMNLGGGTTYETYPTISYAPLQGEEFVKSLLSPISIDAILALTGSGWSVRRVFGLCVESVNGVQNAPSASGPTPDRAPRDFSTWNRLSALFEEVADDHIIQARQDPKTKEIKMEFRSTPQHARAVREIKSILNLDPNLSLYRVEGDNTEHRNDTLHVVTRPLMATLFYLSQRVETPSEHLRKGWVTQTRNPDGTPFDWGQTPGGQLFHVRESDVEPDHPYVAIPYEGHWYYISKDDLESKSTFLLLTQLFRLQAGSAKSIGPTLTIPVR